jgi:hypothetical protein
MGVKLGATTYGKNVKTKALRTILGPNREEVTGEYLDLTERK